jgi:hypothetical protein
MIYYRLAFLLLCCAIIFLPFGCGKEASESIVFRHPITDPSGIRILNELIEEFNKENNSNIIQVASDDDDIAGFPDSSWDIALIPAHRTAWYAVNGFISQLKAGDSITHTINRFSDSVSFYNGRLYSIPLFMDVYTLLSNPDCININDLTDLIQLPFSSDFSSYPDSIPGFAVPAFGNESFYSLVFFLQLCQNQDDSTCNVMSRIPINIGSLSLYLQTGYETRFESRGLIQSSLLRGEIASCFSNSSIYLYNSRSFSDNKITVSGLPNYQNKASRSLICCQSLVVNNKSNNKPITEKFISFLISDPISLRLAKIIKAYGFPANINLAPVVRKTDNFRKAQYNQLEHASAFGSNPSFYLIEKYLDVNLGECINGNISPWEILSSMQSLQEKVAK